MAVSLRCPRASGLPPLTYADMLTLARGAASSESHRRCRDADTTWGRVGLDCLLDETCIFKLNILVI
jgi:hypothetical protein